MKCAVCGTQVMKLVPTDDPVKSKVVATSDFYKTVGSLQFCQDHKDQAKVAAKNKTFRGK